jgi:hypothetical protein
VTSLRDAIADAVAQLRAELVGATWRMGTVSGTSGTKVVVAVQGGSMTIPRLAAYTPVNGDTVLIAATPIGWICLGKPA